MDTASDSFAEIPESAPTVWVVGKKSSLGRLADTVFSFPVMCLVSIMGMIFVACRNSIAESDLWWHLRNASYFLQYHSLPRVDMYSFGAAGSPWLDHEWLSELLFYLAFKSMRLQGVQLLYYVILVLIFAAVYIRSCRAGANCKNAAVVTCIGAFIAPVPIGPRMLLFGWLCMVGLLLVLDQFEQSGKGLWLMPPLFVLWINLHGSWVFGMMVLAVTIASGLVEGQWGLVVARRWSGLQLKKLLLTLTLSVAALFVNPFGFRLPLYPFDLLFRQSSNMKHMLEWQSADFNTITGRLAMIMILALLAATFFSRRLWRLDEVILATFALWSALTHVRFFFFAALVLPPILVQHLSLFPPYDKDSDKPWLNASIMAAIVVAMIFFYPSQANLRHQIDETFPTAALDFMHRGNVRGRLFNSYRFGGYMEWYSPDLKPFIDGRADIFVYNGTFDEAFKATYINDSFEFLDKYRFDYVLFEPNTPLSYLLDHSLEWKIIYADSVAKLYQKVGIASNATMSYSSLEAHRPSADGAKQTRVERPSR